MLVVTLGVAPLLFARGNFKELTVPLKFMPQEGEALVNFRGQVES